MRAVTVIEGKATARKHQHRRLLQACGTVGETIGDVNTVIASRSRRRRRCHPLRARHPINSTRLAAHVFTTLQCSIYTSASEYGTTQTRPIQKPPPPPSHSPILARSQSLRTYIVIASRLPNDAGTTTTFFIHRFPTFTFVTSFSRCPYLAMDLRRQHAYSNNASCSCGPHCRIAHPQSYCSCSARLV